MRSATLPSVPPGSAVPAPEPGSGAERWLRARPRWVLGAVVALSVAVRLGYLADLGAGPLGLHRWPESDMRYFHDWGVRIASGDLLSRESTVPQAAWAREVAERALRADPRLGARIEAVREPGQDPAWLVWDRWLGPHAFFWDPLYPYLVGATYRLAGPEPRAVFAWQLALGVLTNVLLLLLATRLLGALAGAVTGVAAALYAPLVFYELVLLRETVIVFASVLLVWLFLAAAERRRAGWWFAWGLAAGAAVLLKATFVLLVAGLAAGGAVLAWRRRDRGGRSLAAAGCGLVLALAPLVARNVAVGAPPLATASSGALMFVFTNSATSSAREFGANLGSAARILAAADGRFLPAVGATLASHAGPGSYLRLLRAKVATVAGWYEAPDNANFHAYRARSRVLAAVPLTFLVVGPLAAVGLALALRRLRETWPLLVLAAAGLVPALVFIPLSRYRLPVAAAALPLAALAAVEIAGCAVRRRIAPAAALAGTAALLAAWSALGSLPPGYPVVRAADFAAMYVFGDLPEIERADGQGDLLRARGLVEDALRVEPPDVSRVARGEPPAAAVDGWMLELFRDLHARHAALLARTGDVGSAAAWEQSARRLDAALRARGG